MSDIHVEVVQITSLNPHVNADKLEVASILGTECCVPKDTYKVGDLVVWFPPHILIPNAVAVKLGVENYLKHSTYPGDTVQSKCRVAACRLRGTPSYGFIASMVAAAEAMVPVEVQPVGDLPLLTSIKVGDTVDAYFGAHKYEPPAKGDPSFPRPKGFNGDAAPDNENFHKYTDIENYYRNANAIPDGEQVRITEKLHGSNARLGLVSDGNGEFLLQAGSHKVNWKPEDAKGNTPIWWQMMTEPVVQLLHHLCNAQHNVILFGEVFGPGVQDMDYGVEETSFRVFDISVDRRYLDWAELLMLCVEYGVQMVPVLYIGPFSKAVLDEYTNGPTEMPGEPKSKFKGREGVVVTPLLEQFSRVLGGRMILKSVSADYLDRKGAQDNA